MRPGLRRVFVYLPLEGENQDDRENEHAREQKPDGLRRDACVGGRHRFLHTAGSPWPCQGCCPLWVDARPPQRLGFRIPMTRATIAISKPFFLVARIRPR